MRSGQGFLIVYSITSRTSFDEAASFHRRIAHIKDVDDIAVVLVGNKSDLEEVREVTTAEGAQLARGWNSPFYETSALSRVNVEVAFHDIVREIRKSSSDMRPKGWGQKDGGGRRLCTLI